MAIPLFFSLLLLLSSATPSCCVEFWNIDCGATDGFTSTINLTWFGDGSFVRSGTSYQVQNTTGLTTSATLRAFPNNKKNCYTVPVGLGKKVQVTVRFYYGNYDGLENPPVFELMFDGNYWSPVSPSRDAVATFVIVYVTKRSETSVCVGKRENGGVPFVSSIQVVVLEPQMYGKVNSSYALYVVRSVAFGLNKSIRYPDDPYDRIWTPSESSLEGLSYPIVENNSTKYVDTSRSTNSPPEKIFSAAALPPKGEIAKNLTIMALYLPNTPQLIYFTMYFSEMLDPRNTAGKTRSFDTYVGGKLLSNSSDPITPQSGNAIEFSGVVEVTNATQFTLMRSRNSQLSPIISGWEVSWVSDVLSNGTQSNDVDALSALQEGFEILKEWTGDPCLPVNYSWEWVACSFDDPPRIIKLSLSGYGLTGTLPDFSNLTALEVINLHNNGLNGRIPDFLGKFPNLKELNLAYNNFSGIPLSLSNNNGKINLTVIGNPSLGDSANTPVTVAQSSQAISTSENGWRSIAASICTLHLIFLVMINVGNGMG